MQRTRRITAATLAALFLITGCTASEPEPTVAPPTVGEVVPEQYRTPEPKPTPSASGIRLISAPASFGCRPATEVERDVVRSLVSTMEGKPVQAVDAGDGWAVVAYWRDGTQETIVTNGIRSNRAAPGWNGYFRPAGVRLEGGEAARLAALQCIG